LGDEPPIGNPCSGSGRSVHWISQTQNAPGAWKLQAQRAKSCYNQIIRQRLSPKTAYGLPKVARHYLRAATSSRPNCEKNRLSGKVIALGYTAPRNGPVKSVTNGPKQKGAADYTPPAPQFTRTVFCAFGTYSAAS